MPASQKAHPRPAAKSASALAAPGGAAMARLRQRVGAASLIVSPLALAGSVFCYAWATRNGGDDYSGASALELYSAHPELVAASAALVLAGGLLMVPAFMAAPRLLRPGSPRLSLAAGSMMVAGYAALIDAAQQDGGFAGTWPLILFVAGNILGTLLLAIAVFRSRAVHWWIAAAVACWPVSHIIGLSVGSEWFEFAGALLQLARFPGLALAVLRIPAHRWDGA